MNATEVLGRNIGWFMNSGVLQPVDGRGGVAERIVLMNGNVAADAINRMFQAQTILAPGVVVLEHRRPDCICQTALLFDTAAMVLSEPLLAGVADGLIDYLLHRSGLRNTDPDSPARDLWGWAAPTHPAIYWTDDNAWVAIICLLLAERGRPHLRDIGIATARALHRHVAPYLLSVEAQTLTTSAGSAPLLRGLRMNPHWLGLVTMALACAAELDSTIDYRDVVRRYHALVPAGPRTTGRESGLAPSGRGWSQSEQAYLSLTASVAARQFDDLVIRDVARQSADSLVGNQAPDGHFRSEHDEAPKGAFLADLIYTQNWATLGLQQAAALFNSEIYRGAARRSLDFLARIQDCSSEPWLAGCWRGAYDCGADTWGGGDLHEGGAGSIYTGWTNAPIALAFLSEMTGVPPITPLAVQRAGSVGQPR